MTQPKLHDRPLVFDQQQTQMLDRCLLRLADRTAAPLVMLADVSGSLGTAMILPIACYAIIALFGIYARRPAAS